MGALPVPDTDFRDALARFASGVTVVTASGAKGPVGFTATGFTSVSLAPHLVLVCVKASARAHDGIVGATRFGVSILADGQTWIAEQFARSGIDRFDGVPLREGDLPLVDGAVAALECRPHARYAAGDHTILIGEVLETFLTPGRPLVHYARRFGIFAAESASTRAAPALAREKTWKGGEA